MGVDINGWVEFQQAGETTWNHCIDISLLIDRNYDAFGCLFGVQNYARFAPLAAERGLPLDCSDQVRHDTEEIGEYAFGHTWVGWSELHQLDPLEVALAPDERVHQYRFGAEGELVYEGKATWSRDLAALLTRRTDCEAPSDGQQWQVGDRVYRAERLTRGEVLGEDWHTLFELMATLANRYGPEHIRLVAWFV